MMPKMRCFHPSKEGFKDVFIYVYISFLCRFHPSKEGFKGRSGLEHADLHHLFPSL